MTAYSLLLKSLLTNARVDQRLAGIRPNPMISSQKLGSVIGSIWDGDGPLEVDQIKIGAPDLARLLGEVNGRLAILGDTGVPLRSHSDIRLVRYKVEKANLVVDISIDGVLLPLQTDEFNIDEELFEPGWISKFANGILIYIQSACKVRSSCARRDHIMAYTMTKCAAASGNPALPLWLRLSPVYTNSFMMPKWETLCYDFVIQILDDKLQPGVAFGCALSGIQLQGLVELYIEFEYKLQKRKRWLLANNASTSIDSLSTALLKHHNIDLRMAYLLCFEEHLQTGKPLVIHETETAQHSIFFESGTMRCNVTAPQVSITGRLLSVHLELPAATILAAPGRMIGELLENSVFAASQAKVIKAELWYNRTSFELETHEEFIRI